MLVRLWGTILVDTTSSGAQEMPYFIGFLWLEWQSLPLRHCQCQLLAAFDQSASSLEADAVTNLRLVVNPEDVLGDIETVTVRMDSYCDVAVAEVRVGIGRPPLGWAG